VDCGDGYHDGQVPHLEVADPVLDCHGDDVVVGSRLLGTAPQHLLRSGVLGVVQGDHGRTMVVISNHAEEERHTAHRGTQDGAEQPVNAQRRVADAGGAYRWCHGSTIVVVGLPCPRRIRAGVQGVAPC
jgi:hypothetical protein